MKSKFVEINPYLKGREEKADYYKEIVFKESKNGK